MGAILHKGFTVAIALLFLITAFIGLPVNVSAAFSGSITINADGTVTPSTAPIVQYGNYYKVTDDIHGSITILKSSVSLDGNGHFLKYGGVRVYSMNYVSVRNFEINGCSVGVDLRSGSGNSIFGNTFTYCYYGALLNYGSNSVHTNTFSYNTFNINVNNANSGYISYNTIAGGIDGIRISDSQSFNINRNTISDYDTNGIFVNGGRSHHISDNTVTGTNDYPQKGIYLSSTSSIQVYDNTVSENYYDIYLDSSQFSNVVSANNVYNGYYGIYFNTGSGYNTMAENNIYDNAYGVYISSSSNNNNIRYNTITSTYASITLASSFYNTVFKNTCTNSKQGLYSYGASYNTITENDFSSNLYHGCYLTNSEFNTISYNTVSSNGVLGLALEIDCDYNNIFRNTVSGNKFGLLFHWYSKGGRIYENNFIDNTYQFYLAYTTSVDYYWDNGAGVGNYWSDYTGSDTNDDGIGDTLVPHPYTDQGNGYFRLDNYPLMEPWASNIPPVADAGPDLEVILGETITLDGSGSYDTDGEIVDYIWYFHHNNEIRYGKTITYDFTSTGVYFVSLYVLDNDGAIDSDKTGVRVISRLHALEYLLTEVHALNLQDGLENSMVSKLDNALKSMLNDRPSVSGQIGAFINEVEAKRGKELTDEQADEMITFAGRLLAVI